MKTHFASSSEVAAPFLVAVIANFCLTGLAYAQASYATPYTFTTLAGSPGTSGISDGQGAAARFYFPRGLGTDSGGNIYVADTYNDTIRKVTPDGNVTTYAGLPNYSGLQDGTGSNAVFNQPTGVAVDGAGNVWVADTYNYVIRGITTNQTVYTDAGSHSYGHGDGPAAKATFSNPYGIAVDSNFIYVADTDNHIIRKIDSNWNVTTMAGSPGVAGWVDAPGSQARFNTPVGLAADQGGNVYVADTYNHVIRKIDANGNVSTLAGVHGFSGFRDGATGALFSAPRAVAVDGDGNVFVADSDNNAIRKITPAGVVTTLAGGSYGSGDGTGASARFSGPRGIAVDAAGRILVADSYNHTIRVGTLALAPNIVTSPKSQTISQGGDVTFTVTATGTQPLNYHWRYNGANITAATYSTLTLTKVPLTWAGYFDVIVSNSAGSAYSDLAHLTVVTALRAPTITIKPASLSLKKGQNAVFSVGATGTAPLKYTWQKNKVSLANLGNVRGVNTNVLTISKVTAANAGSYRVLVQNGAGTATSTAVKLAVK